MTIDELTKAIDTLKSEISEMQVQLKRAGEDPGERDFEEGLSRGSISGGTTCLTLLVQHMLSSKAANSSAKDDDP